MNEMKDVYEVEKVIVVVKSDENVFFEMEVGKAWRAKDRMLRAVRSSATGIGDDEVTDIFLEEVCKWANSLNGAGDDEQHACFVTDGVAEYICRAIEACYEKHKKKLPDSPTLRSGTESIPGNWMPPSKESSSTTSPDSAPSESQGS